METLGVTREGEVMGCGREGVSGEVVPRNVTQFGLAISNTYMSEEF